MFCCVGLCTTQFLGVSQVAQAVRDEGVTGFLGVSKVAKKLDFSLRHTYDLLDRGVLPFVWIGGRKRVPESALADLAARAHAEQQARLEERQALEM